MRHLITALFLLAALPFYAIGMATGAVICLVIGGALELGFWLRLFSRQGDSASG